MPSISYAITACNEHVELERLLEMLENNINTIIETGTNAGDTTEFLAKLYPKKRIIVAEKYMHFYDYDEPKD
jgi:hypothetical protein